MHHGLDPDRCLSLQLKGLLVVIFTLAVELSRGDRLFGTWVRHEGFFSSTALLLHENLIMCIKKRKKEGGGGGKEGKQCDFQEV